MLRFPSNEQEEKKKNRIHVNCSVRCNLLFAIQDNESLAVRTMISREYLRTT